MDDTRLSVSKPSAARYVATRRGMPSSPRMCCTKNVMWKPTNVSKKCSQPRRSLNIGR